MYKRGLGFLLMLVFSVSCSTKGNLFMSGVAVQSRVKPDVEREISPDEVITGEALFSARGIWAKIDNLYIFSAASEDYSFFVYDASSDKVVLEFPYKGRGPEEQILSTFTQVRRTGDSVEIDVLGLNEHELLTIDLYRSIEQQHPEVIRRTPLPPNTMYAHTFGDKLAATVLFDEYDYSLQIFDAKRQEREEIILPFGPEDLDPGLITNTCLMKEDGTKCLWAMHWLDKFNILDLNNREKSASYSTRRRTPSDKQLHETIVSMPPASVTAYYTRAQATDDDVFLLYWGFSEAEKENRQREIQQFDWDGRYKGRFIINEAIDTFVLSEDATALYGYCWDETTVYKYTLKP